MGALLGFAPFIAFALVEKAFGIVPGLACGFAVSLALLVRDFMRGEREINVLEAGSALMFGGLTGAALASQASWSLWQVRLWVDGGLALVVLLSIAVRRPFTVQHARHMVTPQVAASPAFLRTNNIISGAWALAFVVLAAADLLMVSRPEAPTWMGVGPTLAALAGAALFTRWYPRHVRSRRHL